MCISIHLSSPATAQDLEFKPVAILPSDTSAPSTLRWMPGNNPQITAEQLQQAQTSDIPISTTVYWAGGFADGNGLLLQDPYLQPVASQLRARYEMYSEAIQSITNSPDGLDTYTKGYDYFGIHHIVCVSFPILRSSQLTFTSSPSTCTIPRALYLRHYTTLHISPLRLSLLDSQSLAHVLKS